jgi:hypothetical protein
MSEWLNWSQIRLLGTLALSYLLFAEVVSLLLSDGATCVVNPAAYGPYYADNHVCPALHVFFFKLAAALFGDPNNITLLATIAIAAFTGTLWWSTSRTADIAKRSLTEVQRAFVFVESFDLKQLPGADPERPFYCSNVWKNSGTTRTVRGRNYISWKPFGEPLPEDFSFPDINQNHKEYPSLLIGPGGTIIGQMLEIPFQYVRRAAEQECHLYVWGWCEYNDVFPGTRRHRTEFCVKIQPVSKPFDAEEPGKHAAGLQFSYHTKHNGADEDCLKPVRT